MKYWLVLSLEPLILFTSLIPSSSTGAVRYTTETGSGIEQDRKMPVSNLIVSLNASTFYKEWKELTVCNISVTAVKAFALKIHFHPCSEKPDIFSPHYRTHWPILSSYIHNGIKFILRYVEFTSFKTEFIRTFQWLYLHSIVHCAWIYIYINIYITVLYRSSHCDNFSLQ